MTTVSYQATRLIHDSAVDFEETRRFDEQVPLLDPLLILRLVLDQATWRDIEVLVDRTVGPTGFVALAQLDQGALFSLGGDPVQATLYLVGNPVIARKSLRSSRRRVSTHPSAWRSTATPWARMSSTTNHQASSRRCWCPTRSTGSHVNSTRRFEPQRRRRVGDRRREARRP